MARPRILSDDERREKRRLKTAKWRSENRERSREITNKAMKKATDAKAISEGRIAGLVGRPPIPLTPEEKRAKQNNRAKRYYAEHIETARVFGAVAARNRRARIRKVGGKHSASDIEWLKKMQKGKCSFCLQLLGGETPHVDHFVPLVLGGSNDRKNLRLLHPLCNLMKASTHPLEHGLRHGLLAW